MARKSKPPGRGQTEKEFARVGAGYANRNRTLANPELVAVRERGEMRCSRLRVAAPQTTQRARRGAEEHRHRPEPKEKDHGYTGQTSTTKHPINHN